MRNIIFGICLMCIIPFVQVDAQDFTGYTRENSWGKAILFNNTDYIIIKVGGISGKNNQIVFYDSESSVWQGLQVGAIYNTSDAQLKTNITSIGQGLSTVLLVKPVTYSWKKTAETIGGNTKSGLPPTGSGFLAQDVQKIIPDAVIESEAGDLLVDYNSIIPYMAQAISELQDQIDDLRKQLEAKAEKADIDEIRSSTATNNNFIASFEANLGQNAPNPFNNSTTISYTIPEQAGNASISVYSIQGSLVENYNLPNKGNSILNIYAGDSKSGMYLYSLVIDSKVISTRRMLVSK